jgi:hypothetical protein
VIAIPPRRLASPGVLALAAVGALAGCSSGSGNSSSASSTAAAASQPGQQQGGQGGDSTQLAAIQKCLSAAGISMPMPPSGQAGQGGGQPGQSGSRPSGPPSGAPTVGTPSSSARGGGQVGGTFFDPKVIAALKACGITVPTNGPGQAGAAPSASATK